MYPIFALPHALNRSLVQTGAPIANLLILATVLLLAGLMLLRSAALVTDTSR